MSQLVTVTRHSNIALVLLDNPPVNALSHAVRVLLVDRLSQLFADDGVHAIVIACEGRTFIAGADIREFGKAPLAPDVPELVELLDGAPKPTIAAIHGTALGGGLELALACHFRVASASAKLGLPEVTLGILPGAGGTQRLPRLIGVRAALDLIVGGAPISAAQAERLGLIDAIVSESVKESGLELARRVLAEGRPVRRVSALTATVDEPSVLVDYERSVAERFRGFPAPLRCVAAVRGAVELPFAEGLELERALFKELMALPESKAQRHLFFGEREVAKVPGLADDTPVRSVKSVALLGAGSAAGPLAKAFVDARVAVTLLADTEEQLERSLSELAGAGASRELIRPTVSFEDAREADLLVECAPDEPSAKRVALARLAAVAKPDAIIASTSVRLEVDDLASATERPADVVALHLTSPLGPPKLLEVASGPRTSPSTLASSMKLGRSLGKIAVATRGHVASRLSARRGREALSLLEEGALPEDVDRASTEVGFSLGPLLAFDLQGLQAALLERKASFPELSARERGCTIFEELALLGRLGKRSGAGFYLYTDGRAAPDPAVVALLERYSQSRGIARRRLSAEELGERLLYGTINEAARLLGDGLAPRALDIDMIAVHGCGFPPYRGGPLFFAEQQGLRAVEARLLHYREQTGEDHFTPAPLLQRLCAEGRGFYGAPR